MNSKGVKADPILTVEEAKRHGGIVEIFRTASDADRLIILAPHGGGIEPVTSAQAQSIYNELLKRGRQVALWTALGYQPGGGAYKRWHVPSTEIEVEDFPKLGAILHDVPWFAKSLALHGTKKHQFFIGGTACEYLKQEVVSVINKATKHSYVVDIVSSGPYGGVHPNNIANRLARESVQIEQPMLARLEFGDEIAWALVNLFSSDMWS